MKSYRQIITYDKNIGYKYLANLNCTIIGDREDNMIDYKIKTDSFGFRNEENLFNSLIKNNKFKTDCIFLGCSFTAGDGVDNKSRFSDLLCKNFYNAALPGSCFIQQTLSAIECSKYIQVKKILFMPHLGCILRNNQTERSNIFFNSRQIWTKPKVEFIENDLVFKNIPVQRPSLEFRNGESINIKLMKEKFKNNFKKLINTTPHHLISWEREFQSNHQKRLVKALYAKVLESYPGAKSFLVPIPTKSFLQKSNQKMRRTINKFFEEVSNSINGEYFDISKILMGEEYSKYFYNEGHLNRKGHLRFAELLNPIINLQ